MWSFPNHYFLQFCLETITSTWYPPSIIKTHKITKWGSFFRLQSGAAQKLQSGAKKSQSGLKNHKMGHSNGISLE